MQWLVEVVGKKSFKQQALTPFPEKRFLGKIVEVKQKYFFRSFSTLTTSYE
jgi:hypothetical protein